MDDKLKRKMIRNYFDKLPNAVYGFAFAGLICFCIACLLYGQLKVVSQAALNMIGIGVFLLALGWLVWYMHSRKPRATDEQFDAFFSEDLTELNDHALSKMGMQKSQLVREPVNIVAPKLWDTAGATKLHKTGKDKASRYTPINITAINFTANQLLVYECIYDILTGNPLNERTDEYFYKDVVSVSTRKESLSIKTSEYGVVQLNEAETFILTTSGGTSVSVLLRAPALIQRLDGGDVSITTAEKAIQAIRQMLREKKSA